MEGNILNQKKTEFGIYDAALATLLFVIFNVLFLESFYFYVAVKGISAFGLWFAQFFVEALFGIAAIVVAKLNKVNIIKAAGLNKKVNIYMIIYAVLISIVSIIFFAGLTNVFVQFLSLIGYTGVLGSMPVNDFGSYIAYVFAVCITPAVCEELLFRGTIQAGMKKFGKWISIFVSAFIFMIMHGGPEQTIHQFIIGVITGLIFFETGNVWLGIIIHFFNNFISVTELYFYNTMVDKSVEGTTEVTNTLSSAEALGQFMINLLIALVMAAIGFIIVKKLIQKLVAENDKLNSNTAIVAENKTVLVDGDIVETEVFVSENENTNKEKSSKNKVEEKPTLDKASFWLFAIPLAWLIFQWVYELIIGFSR